MTDTIHCIIGPTASGKTAYGIKLAKEKGAAIISVDSRQIYFGMDIGTAKEAVRLKFNKSDYTTTWQEPYLIEGVPHYLMDICLPHDRYTAFDFKEQALWLISKLKANGQKIIFVGGTGLYFDALIFDYQPSKIGKSSNIRVKTSLEQEYLDLGGNTLWDRLVKFDPISAAKIHPHNHRQLIRALEYYIVTGLPKSQAVERSFDPVFPVEVIGMEWPRHKLYERIEKRIDHQMANGLLNEVKELRSNYEHNLPAMSSLGYKELGAYLDGETDLETAVSLFKQHTRNYAKRQLTWFRRYKNVNWIKADQCV